MIMGILKASEKIFPYIVCRFQWKLKKIMAGMP
jgi:hypothetical protein